jgi:hypothetical protein
VAIRRCAATEVSRAFGSAIGYRAWYRSASCSRSATLRNEIVVVTEAERHHPATRRYFLSRMRDRARRSSLSMEDSADGRRCGLVTAAYLALTSRYTVGGHVASFSSLSILEQFYGEELSRALLSKIRATPSGQLAELADRLVQHGKSVNLSLLHRSGRRQIDHALGEEIPLPPPLLESFTRGPLSVYDDLFLDPFNSKPSSRRGALKHALLYSERLLLPDRALDWGHELLLEAGLPDGLQDDGQAGGDLADLLIEYLPLMELVRRDEVLLASNSYVNLSSDSDDYGGLFWFLEGDIRSPVSDSYIFATDPNLAWVVVNRVGSLESWELDAYGRNTIEALVDAAGDILRDTAIYPETDSVCERS